MNSMQFIRNSGHMLLIMVLPVALSAQGLQITNGGHLVLNGAIKLVLHNASITNNGNIATGNSLVFFTGNKQARISGNNLILFNDVMVDKPSFGFVLMQQDINISGRIFLNAGNLVLNTHTLDLGTTGNIIGERDHAQISGTAGGRILVMRKAATALNAFNPGNIGLEITSPVAPGIVVIERRHRAVQLTDDVRSIERSFIISSQVNTGMNATVRFFYLETELNLQDESSLLLWKGSDAGSSWIPLKSTVDPTTHSLTITGLDQWDRFTAANPGQVSMLRTKNVQKTLEPIMRVFPNPSRDVFTVELFSPGQKNVVLGLYDQWGRMLKKKPAHLIAGMNRIQWDLGPYAAGVYYIAFENQEMKNLKITKE